MSEAAMKQNVKKRPEKEGLRNPVQGYGVAPIETLRPDDIDSLQAMIRHANEQGSALVPASSQGPHTKTGLCCRNPHRLLDLSHWKAIDFISRRNRVAQVATGVTYTELLDALAGEGLTVPMPLAPRRGKSVLASCCERQPVTWSNKQWESIDPMACMEFVFGTGDVFRTGAAGGPGTLEQQRAVGQAQKAPLGPGATDFHRLVQGSQGSFGVASWISIRAELKPSIEEAYLLGSENLSRMVAYTYDVQRAKLGEESFIMNRCALTQLVTAHEAIALQPLYDALPEWICLQVIAGFERLPRERLRYQKADIRQAAATHRLRLSSRLAGLDADQVLRAARSLHQDDDWRHALQGQALSISFQTTLDRCQEFLQIVARERALDASGGEWMGVYLQPINQNRACEVELIFPYCPGDIAEVAQRQAWEARLVNALNQAHAFFARPYGYAETQVFANNPLNTRVLQKLKGIFDPNRVLNPGKFGL